VGFKILSSGNLLLGLLLGGVLQQLWGNIRSMKTIVLLILIAVPFPPLTNIFFIACGEIANIDIFNGEAIYEKNFSFKETVPLNK
jgi:hypothetical protein